MTSKSPVTASSAVAHARRGGGDISPSKFGSASSVLEASWAIHGGPGAPAGYPVRYRNPRWRASGLCFADPNPARVEDGSRELGPHVGQDVVVLVDAHDGGNV